MLRGNHGKKEGTWYNYPPLSDTPYEEITYKDGKRVSLNRVNHKTVYNKGVVEKMLWFFNDGQIKTYQPYSDGKPHGTWYDYHEGEQKRYLYEEINYSNGQKHGEHTKYCEDGRMIETICYNKDDKIKHILYDEDDQSPFEVDFDENGNMVFNESFNKK